MKSCREHYAKVDCIRRKTKVKPHEGPHRRFPEYGLPIKRCGARFGNFKEIPTNRTLECPPFCCLNCRRDFKCGGHKTRDCPEPYIQHCHNSGHLFSDVMDCPWSGEVYIREGYYGKNSWAWDLPPIYSPSEDPEGRPQPRALASAASSTSTMPERAFQTHRPLPPRSASPVVLRPLAAVVEQAHRSVGTSPPPPLAQEIQEKMDVAEDAPQAQAPADAEGDDTN